MHIISCTQMNGHSCHMAYSKARMSLDIVSLGREQIWMCSGSGNCTNEMIERRYHEWLTKKVC